jgi:hypothetical protein
MSLYSPSLSIHSTEDENRYFQHFAEHTAYELSGFFDPSFWTRLVLQESHNIAAIRHAVIALGALNKSLENAPGPDLKVNIIQSIDKVHHEQAVLQHLKAIQALNNYISTSNAPQLRNALIACLLFVCFETFQGSYASSVQQTYGGLKILRSYYMGKPGSRPWIPRKLPQELYKSSQRTGKISMMLQSRIGCNDISKDRSMSLHLEEYLETDHTPQLELDDNPLTTEQLSPIESFTSPAYDPRADKVDIPTWKMNGASFNVEQQITTSMFAPDDSRLQSNTMSPTNETPQPSWTPAASRKKSSTISISTVSTPVTYTPPSTGPHTPAGPSPTGAGLSQAFSSGIKRTLASRSTSPIPLLQNDLTIEEVLIQSFVRLDGQGLFFGMTPGIPPLIWDIHRTWHLAVPNSFSDFYSAQRCWDFLMDRVLQFYRRTAFNRAYAPSHSDSPSSIAKQHAAYSKQLSAFEKAFQSILDNAIRFDGTVANAAALVLSLYQKCTAIFLELVIHSSEMIFDSFLAEFQYITRTCALLTSPLNTSQLPRNPRFSFDTGIIPPLHVVASKCRDPIVRREAIDILFVSPRQEGMWDGVLSARIGRWLASCEEDGLPTPPFPVGKSHEAGSINGGMEKVSGYPSPPNIVDEMGHGGCWEDGRKISDVVNESVGRSNNEFTAINEASGAGKGVTSRMVVGRKKSIVKEKVKETEEETKGWMVPEKNRVQLMVVDFHMPDRYIKVKCQKTIKGEDETREERETVIAW